MVVDDNSTRANLLKEGLQPKRYQVDVFLGSDNYKKALDALKTFRADSSCIVIADERLGLIGGGGRTGVIGEYAESGLLFCYDLKRIYPSVVKATMVIAAIKGYSTLYGFYDVQALREIVGSLGISGYITKPINSKNILRVIKKIEKVLEKEAQQGKDSLLPLSYMGLVEWLELSAELKTKKLRKLIDSHIHTVEVMNSHVPLFRIKREEVYSEIAHKLGERIMKSIKYTQQVIETIDRNVLSEEGVLQLLFETWRPDKEPFPEAERDRTHSSWEDDYNLKVARRRYVSNAYGDKIARSKFNGVMEILLRGMEYVACIGTEIENFVTNLMKVMAKETIEMRMRIRDGKGLTALKNLFNEIITIRERLKGSIILQQRQLRIFSDGLLRPSATAIGTSSATNTKTLAD
jgi:CheY-like chemotaxis protein